MATPTAAPMLWASMDLVEVRFAPAGKVVWVRPGTTLLAAGQTAGVEIVTGCTRGMCGTDAVRVAAAADALQPPSDHERGTLLRMGLPADFRLSCSATVQRGIVQVEVGAF
ncbi:MAG: (2Fe-2S)-binding protein [Planctomycetes bacterium]|nr:(2Fe-2S)-binding protein [Planctomycetota bacterium]